MNSPDLQGIVHNVLCQAQKQGFVVPSDVRAELSQAGLPESHWKAVVEQAQPSLRYRHGRYYYVAASVSRLRDRIGQQQKQKRSMYQAVRQLIRRYKTSLYKDERRTQNRVQFLQPVTIVTDDDRELHCLSRDISTSGIRVICDRSLMGQRVRMLVPNFNNGGGQWAFIVQVVWAGIVGDGLVENGGFFVEMIPNDFSRGDG
jgi:hypothetical protein